MIYFEADNSNDMAPLVYRELNEVGLVQGSRNGRVLRFEEPITTTYRTPWHRANFTVGRDANPFFHIAEAMWMLAGRRDVDFLTYFNKGMAQYSDDGSVFNAAYGYRARHEFGFDQLVAIPRLLEKDPGTRQAVIQLWHPSDLGANTLDKACNMSMVFSIFGTRLDMTVFNRSNDLVFGGVTGANPVHFSYFQQWVANQLKIPMGHLTFVSNNAHVYTEMPHWERMEFMEPSSVPRAIELPLGDLDEIESLCNDYHLNPLRLLSSSNYDSYHIKDIVIPLFNTWRARRMGEDFNEHLNSIACPALMLACFNWTQERNHEH